MLALLDTQKKNTETHSLTLQTKKTQLLLFKTFFLDSCRIILICKVNRTVFLFSMHVKWNFAFLCNTKRESLSQSFFVCLLSFGARVLHNKYALSSVVIIMLKIHGKWCFLSFEKFWLTLKTFFFLFQSQTTT